VTPVAALAILALSLSPSLGGGACGGSAPVFADGLRPDTILRPDGGPSIAVFHGGASEVVSIRASVPLIEAVEEGGAGQLLRIQAQARMESLAGRIGARVEVHRTTRSMIYQVSGSVQDLDYLSWILREGMGPPEASRFDAAARQALVDLQRQLETPEGTLARRLVQSLSPGIPPLQGSEGVLERLDASRLSAIWARSHVRPEVRVVVVGRVDPTLLLATLADLSLPEEGPRPQLPPIASTGESRGSPEVIRHWMARAFLLDDVGAASLISSRHLSLLLRESPGDFEASVELWEVGAGRALIFSGAAYSRSRQALQTRLAGLLNEGLQSLDATRVRRIAAELEREIRLASRHPWGLAELAGQAWDSGGSPDGVAELIEEIERTTTEEVRAFLQGLAERTPVVEELRP